MDNKKKLLSLVEKYKETFENTYDYVLCRSLVKKIDDAIVDGNPQSVRIDYDKIMSITEEEMKMFNHPDCIRIIKAIPSLLNKRGFENKNLSVLKRIEFLKDDLINNRLKSFNTQKKSLEFIYDIVDNGKIKDYYKIILEFITASYNNKLIDLETSVNLSFYVLEACNDYSLEDNNKVVEIEEIELVENNGSISDNRNKIEEIFEKYGYQYDVEALRYSGGEHNFVKYANIDYIDYVLGKFKRYGIKQDELYRKKTFYNIIIDNDKESFNSILDFVDQNDCTLSKLLFFPAIFAKRDKEYVMKSRRYPSNGGPKKSLSIAGANEDFFKNIKLYAKLKGVNNINDIDLDAIAKYVSTPHSLIEKNIELLLKFNIISKDNLPSSIVSLCGYKTEYLLDRFIEASLYRPYLLPKTNEKFGIGTSRLYLTTNDLLFYKIKMASLFGDKVLNENGCLIGTFTNNKEEYRGIKLDRNDNGRALGIVQSPPSMDDIDKIDPSIRRWLSSRFYSKNAADWDNISLLEFDNIYKFGVVTPIDIFEKNSVKAELISEIFKKCDYMQTTDNTSVLDDEFIQMLDNAVYCNIYGMEESVKISDFEYKFYHPDYPNYNLIISRYKVLRLCKILKDNECWIDSTTSLLEKENMLMSVLLKDSIVSQSEVSMLKVIVREILTNGFIKVTNVDRKGIK